MFEVEVTREGVPEHAEKSTLGVDERIMRLGKFIYLWQGEAKVDYRIKKNLLYVSDKLYGVDLTKTSLGADNDPDNIRAVIIEADRIGDILHRFPNLQSVKVTGSLTKGKYSLLKPLAEEKTVKLIVWQDCGLTNSALRLIGRCVNLKVIMLTGANLTDRGLNHLVRCKDLRVLDITGATGFSGDGLKFLKKLPILKRLVLSQTGINDFNLRLIDPLFRLQEIFLANTSVSDDGAIILGGYKNLRFLDLRNTAISNKALERLAERLPDSVILSDFPEED